MADPLIGTNAPIVTPLMRASMVAPVKPMISSTPVFVSPSATYTPSAVPIVLHNPNLDTPVQQAQTELNRLRSTGSGIDQIHNPLARGIARAADITTQIAGSVFGPLRIAAALTPGTAEHHNYLVHQAEGRLLDEQKNAYGVTQQQDEEAQVEQRRALATQEEAKAQALLHPPSKPATEPKPVSLQQSYADAVTDAISRGVDPSKDPHVQQLADAQTSLQRVPASKEPNKDDKYIAIQSKPRAQWTPEESAYVKGYDQYVEKNKIQPAAVRTNVMLQQPIATVDPNDPSRTVYTTRKDAIGREAPGSGEAAAARSTMKDFASGKDAHTLNAFNTAQYHLQTLARAADALKNGNVTAFNQFAQSYAQATGSAAPTNFDAVKLAVRGEVAKALSGNATVSEQADLDKNFSRASSPAQLAGIASTYHELLEGKKQALRSQYEAGMHGRPDFDGAANNAPPSGARVRDYTQVKK